MSDLDDFFAKKSKKKKSKSSSAVLAGDLLNQKKEQEVRKAKKLKQKDDKCSEPLSTLLKKTQEDEEWNDMETEREPTAADLSKIQNLTISRDTEPLRDGEDRNNGPNEGEDATREDGERQTAAWGFSADPGNASDADTSSTHSGGAREALPTAAAAAAQAPPHSATDSDSAADPKAATGTAQPEPPKPAAYVPPAFRSGGDRDFTTASKRPLKKAVKAPDIGNVMEFPSLGGGPGGGEPAEQHGSLRGPGAPQRTVNSMSAGNKARGFSSDTSTENWRNRDRNSQNSRYGPSRADGKAGGRTELTLENRYSTLSEDY